MHSEKNDGGFMLAETIISVMIAALSGVLILCGISLWVRCYEKNEKVGNAMTVFELVYEDIRSGLLCSSPLGETKIYSEKYGCAGEYACRDGGVFFVEESGRERPLISKRLASAVGSETELSAFEIKYEWNKDGCYSGELRLLYDDAGDVIGRRIEVVPVFAAAAKEKSEQDY